MESLNLNQNSSNEIDFVSLITCLTSTSAKGGETYDIILLLNKCDAKFRKNGCKCDHRAV